MIVVVGGSGRGSRSRSNCGASAGRSGSKNIGIPFPVRRCMANKLIMMISLVAPPLAVPSDLQY